jgi:P-type Cu+ transporter
MNTGGSTSAPAAKVTLDTGGPVTPGVPVTLKLNLTDAATGQPAGNLEVEHEAPMHLIVVSRDLGYFSHVHPTAAAGPGEWAVEHTFPAAGDYILYDEFALEGKADETHSFDLRVGGSGGQSANLSPDLSAKQSGDYRVEIEPVGEVRAGETSSFVLNVTRGGEAVTDLQPYLGAAAHVVVIDQGVSSFAHEHAVAGATPPGGEMGKMGEESEMEPPAAFGPQLALSHMFEKPGLYKLWAQFQHGGEVTTVDWVVEVR